jgi:hypothetical protein
MRAPLEPPGFAAARERVETEGVAVIELRDGLVSRCRQFYDTAEVARQLGAAPPRGSRVEKLGVLVQRISVMVKQRKRKLARLARLCAHGQAQAAALKLGES